MGEIASTKTTSAHDLAKANSHKITIPIPNERNALSISTLRKGTVLHRVHLSKYAATTLNPGAIGNARFSPIQDGHGIPIPTLYAGSSMDCALMETVFHDVPHKSGFNTFDKQKLVNHVHSKIRLKHPLNLIDLGSVALRRLGLKRNQLIDTEKDLYPATRTWAGAAHRICEHAQGLFWVSRQDDSARAVMFFGDRLPAHTLEQLGTSFSLLSDCSTYEKVFNLAQRLGLTLTTGVTSSIAD